MGNSTLRTFESVSSATNTMNSIRSSLPNHSSKSDVHSFQSIDTKVNKAQSGEWTGRTNNNVGRLHGTRGNNSRSVSIGGDQLVRNGQEEQKVEGKRSELDLVFVVDNTGSMDKWIRSVQENLQRIIRDIVDAENANIRFALVSYRDHPPMDHTFVTKTHNFTSDVARMQRWVNEMTASGGGDEAEAVADGLHDALHLNYRTDSTKIVVLVSDAPPHGIGCSDDAFPDGSPNGHDPLEIVNDMAKRGITIYSIICGDFVGQAFYQGVAEVTGGQYVPLSSAKFLAGLIIGGAQEEIALERLMNEARQIAEAEERASGRELGEDEIASALERIFGQRGTITNQTQFGGSELPNYSPSATAFSKCGTINDIRKLKSSAHLEKGSYGNGIDSNLNPNGEINSFCVVKDSITSAQCKRLAKKMKARRTWR